MSAGNRFDLQVQTGTIYVVDTNNRGVTGDPKIIAQCHSGDNAVLVARALNAYTATPTR